MKPNPPDLPGLEYLAPLEYFDTNAFRGNVPAEQDVCDFVLMLAVVYNDFKDVLWAYHGMNQCRQPDREIHPYNGQYVGLRSHLTRMFHSMLFELAELIRRNGDVLEHPTFRETVRQMGKENRGHWEQLVAFSNGRSEASAGNLAKVSMLIRHNISSHYYQPKMLSEGYRDYFSKKSTTANSNAFISRGDSLQATRFYFADAALDGCVERIIGPDKVDSVREALNGIVEAINYSLYDLVQKFVQVRGFAWTRF